VTSSLREHWKEFKRVRRAYRSSPARTRLSWWDLLLGLVVIVGAVIAAAEGYWVPLVVFLALFVGHAVMLFARRRSSRRSTKIP
jgi:Flp pilus assembly protein TadB